MSRGGNQGCRDSGEEDVTLLALAGTAVVADVREAHRDDAVPGHGVWRPARAITTPVRPVDARHTIERPLHQLPFRRGVDDPLRHFTLAAVVRASAHLRLGRTSTAQLNAEERARARWATQRLAAGTCLRQ